MSRGEFSCGLLYATYLLQSIENFFGALDGIGSREKVMLVEKVFLDKTISINF